MARPIDDNPANTRPGAVRDDPARVDDATLGPNARTSVRETELKRHRGGPTLWIVLAVVVALLLAFYLFSGAFSSDPVVGDDVDVVPGVAVDGAVSDGAVVDGGVVDAPAILPDTATTVPQGDVAPTGEVVPTPGN